MLSDTQKKFINEATHLGLETVIVELPKFTTLIIKEPVEFYPHEIHITAVESERGHRNTARFTNYYNESKTTSIKDAGYKMLEWVGR